MDRPKEGFKVLVVHPEAGVRALLDRVLSSAGYAVTTVPTGEAAIERVGADDIHVAVLHLELPTMPGTDTLCALRAMMPPPEVVVTTEQGSAEAAAQAARAGAFDLVTQPFQLKELTQIIRTACEQTVRRRQTQHLEAALRAHDPFPEIVGRSPEIKRVLALIHKAAPTHSPVLIQGESGTGKELVARALHAHSPRANQPLTVVDCGALQDTLLESELFGHERGAFTGAYGLKHGLFETANNGTLFLDEIGEMSPATQVKVLRALQSGEFRRIGSNRHIRADIRIIAATNKQLAGEVKHGRFREDLYYRIAVIEIHMPPLRERVEDIPLLVEHFLQKASYGGRQRLHPTKEALDGLMGYPWPGNIRELRNCIERVSVLADGPILTLESLPPHVVTRGRANVAVVEETTDLPLDEVERIHILRTLERHRWKKRRVAGVLGIDTKTLYNKLRRYGVPLRDPDDKGSRPEGGSSEHGAPSP